MEEKPIEESTDNIQLAESQAASSAPPAAESQSPEPVQQPKSKPRLKKPPRWLMTAALVLVFVGLLTSSFMLYKKSNDLSQRNQNLNSTIASYKKADAKPKKLTDAALQPVTSEIKNAPAPAPADSGSFGGTAVQVNTEDTSNATPKYVGGEYAPYWLLTKFALTIPDGMKMVRTTDVSTDGHLLTADNEGGAGCGGNGIYMTVSSTLSVTGSPIRAWGSSASYPRGLGCGGADPVIAIYAKYYPMVNTNQYKYMELVTADCTTHDDNFNCTGTDTDKTKWRLYSGMVLATAPAYKVGDPLQGSIVAKQLYDRDKNGAQFYMDCANDKYGHFSCNAADYKNDDYNQALKDSTYTQFKNIILNMHEY